MHSNIFIKIIFVTDFELKILELLQLTKWFFKSINYKDQWCLKPQTFNQGVGRFNQIRSSTFMVQPAHIITDACDKKSFWLKQ